VRLRRTDRFRVWTSHGSASYSSRPKAIAAAQWVASHDDEIVAVASESTGHRWNVSPAGRVYDAR
jgi:hypothetical protein